MLFIRFFEGFCLELAYREVTQLVHGFLGGKKIQLPACTYNKIMTTMEYAAEDENFIGFEGTE